MDGCRGRDPSPPREAYVILAILRIGAALGAFVLANSEASFAQSDDELFRRCFNSTIPHQVVDSCSVIITRTTTEKEDLAAAFKDRGIAYDDLGQYNLAMQDFDRSIAIDPNDWDVYSSRGITRIALKLYALAIEDFSQALRLNPSAYGVYSNRCFAMALLGDREAALIDCDRALHLKAGDPAALASRGFVKLLLKQYDSAIADYDGALKSRSDDPYSLYGRGAAKFRRGDLKGADADIVRAQGLRPDIADYMAGLGIRLSTF